MDRNAMIAGLLQLQGNRRFICDELLDPATDRIEGITSFHAQKAAKTTKTTSRQCASDAIDRNPISTLGLRVAWPSMRELRRNTRPSDPIDPTWVISLPPLTEPSGSFECRDQVIDSLVPSS